MKIGEGRCAGFEGSKGEVFGGDGEGMNGRSGGSMRNRLDQQVESI